MADTVYLGSVYATFDLEAEGFNRGIQQAQEGVGNLKNTVLGVFGGNLLTSAVETVGRGLLDFGKSAITAAGDLESGMNLLQQILGATGGEMDLLRQKAVDLGNDLSLPGVSAADAADAMIELGKAGLSVNDTLAASKGVLQAAKAGNIGVAESASYVSNALLAFKLSGSEATRVADLFAAAANATSADIPDLGQALQQVGAQAAALGIPLEDTITMLGELANVGIKGGDAGTSLKVALQRLVPTTDAATQAYKDMGVSVFDANGNFVGAREAIARLAKGTAGMSQEQKQLTLQTIFGTDAFRAASTLIDQNAAGFDKLKGAVTKQGAAADLAAARTKGFNGALEGFKSQMETVAINIGSKLLGPLTDIIQLVSNNLPVAMGIAGGAIAGLGVAALVGAGGFGTLAAAIWAAISPILPFVAAGAAIVGVAVLLEQKFGLLTKAMDFIKPIIKETVNGFKAFFAALSGEGVTSNGFVGFMERIGVALKTVWDIMKPLREWIVDQFISIWDSLKRTFSQLAESFKPLIEAFKEFWQKHGEQVVTVLKILGAVLAAIVLAPLVAAFAAFLAILKVVQVVLKFVADHFELIKNIVLVVLAVALAPLIIAIVAVIAIVKAVIAIIGFLVDAFNWIVNAVTTVVTVIVQVFTTIWTIVSTVIGFVINIITTLATIWFTIWTGIFNVVKFVVELILNLLIIIFGSILIVILTVLNTIFGVMQTVWNAIWGVIQTVGQAIWDFLVMVWQAIYNAVAPIVQAIWDFIVNAFNTLKTWITNTFQAIWDFISGIWNSIYNTISSIVQRIIDFFAPALSWLLQKGKDIINGLINGITSMASGVWNAIKGVADQIGKFFSGVGTWLFDSGKALFEGFINGMKAIGNKVKETAEGIVKKVRDLLPFSPAKDGPFSGKGWTLYSGRSLMEGFAQGISQRGGLVRDAMSGALSQVNPLGSINSSLASLPSVGVGGIAGGNSSSVSTVINGNITIGSEVDADRFLQRLTRNNELAQKGLTTE